MSDSNGHVGFVLGTLAALIVDCAAQYPELTKEFDRDFERLRSAVDSHGLRFVLETMPAYRKHFDKCLDQRRLTPSNLINFGVDKGGAIPRLFRGLTLRVFDRSGALRLDPDVVAIRLLRQLLGAFRKLRIDCGVKARGNAVRDFIRVDCEVRHADLDWSTSSTFSSQREAPESFTDADAFHKAANMAPDLFRSTSGSSPNVRLLQKVQQSADLLTSLIGVFDPMEWRPRHGPGAVADERFGSYKYDFKRWPDRLEHVFPYADFAVANYAQVNMVDRVELVSKGFSHEKPARLCAVPKTIKTPRLIACEPTEFQWCQQTIRDFFYTRVSKTLVGNFIDFRRQELNGELALLASHNGTHATIDLSSASDRISCWHVERLFRRSPSLLSALQASRSTWMKQDICKYSPRFYKLRKYSTMGNATTFPVQSIFFLALALGSLAYARDLPVNLRLLKTLGRKQVRVFGDDIIVPNDCSRVLTDLIHHLELKVNADKTFTEGNFRESCGTDAYGGHDVTTVNIMEVPHRTGPGSIVSSVDVHHNLCNAGYMKAAAYLQKTAGRAVQNTIRYVKHGSGLFGWSDLYGTTTTFTRVKWDSGTQRAVVRALKLRVSENRRPASESAGLLQFFTEAPKQVTSAVSTLNYLARRPKVGLHLGWAPLY